MTRGSGTNDSSLSRLIKVDERDLDWLAERWLNQDCLYNGWCYEADLNYDLAVDFKDFAKLAEHWLQGVNPYFSPP